MSNIDISIKNGESFLTTKDNPYNPFNQFDEWFLYDCEKGYYTCNYLDRVAQSIDFDSTLGRSDDNEIYDLAMREIVEYNPELYTIVSGQTEGSNEEL